MTINLQQQGVYISRGIFHGGGEEKEEEHAISENFV